MEIWKDIKGYEDYKVSNLGRVKNKHGRVIALVKNNGYDTIQLHKDNIKKRFSVHRLVAEVFIPNPSRKPQINHLNSKRDDNRVENLEWVTQKENNTHRYNQEFIKRTVLVFDKRTGDLLHELDLNKVNLKRVYLKKIKT